MRFKGLGCMAGIAFSGLTFTALAGPVTINFDDIDASQADIPIVSPYHGLTWSNVTAYSAVPGFDGFNHGIVSGPNAAYSGGQTFSSGVTPLVGGLAVGDGIGAFDFLSADLGSGYYTGLAVTFQGYRAGSLLFTRTVTAMTTAPVLVSFGFLGIDRLSFSSAATAASTDPFACGNFNCTQFTLDDLSVVTYPAAVPEPGSTALLLAGLGLFALGYVRKPSTR